MGWHCDVRGQATQPTRSSRVTISRRPGGDQGGESTTERASDERGSGRAHAGAPTASDPHRSASAETSDGRSLAPTVWAHRWVSCARPRASAPDCTTLGLGTSLRHGLAVGVVSHRNDRTTPKPTPPERPLPSRNSVDGVLPRGSDLRRTTRPDSIDEGIVAVAVVKPAKRERGQTGVQHQATSIIETHTGSSSFRRRLTNLSALVSVQAMPTMSLPACRGGRLPLLAVARVVWRNIRTPGRTARGIIASGTDA
jgi:hypothetical protein